MKMRDPRRIFIEATVPEVHPVDDGRIVEVRKYRLITPLFGGGVKAQEADPITVIRGASVRGQLRFWWRATRGGQFGGDLEKMREAENAIWGSAAKKSDENSGPSKVALDVKILNRGKPFHAEDRKGDPVRNIGEQSSIYSYVAFPLRENANAAVLQDVEFELTIWYPVNLQKDVQAAIWAWETFGGIGARTRRGFGALQLTHINDQKIQQPSSTELQKHIENELKNHLKSGEPLDRVPSLTPTNVFVIIGSKRKDVVQTNTFAN